LLRLLRGRCCGRRLRCGSLLQPGLEVSVAAECVAQKLLDDAMLATAFKKLAIVAQHLGDRGMDANVELFFFTGADSGSIKDMVTAPWL